MRTGYVGRVLQPNERVVCATRLHWRIYVRCAVLLLLSAAFAVAARSFPDRQPEIGLALRIVAGMFLLLALSAGLRALVRRATTELAITVHPGPHDDIDVTYGRLGAWVLGHALAVDGPVHETYLVGPEDTDLAARWQTEIGWPIFRLTPA